jgi:hypothetical protein
MKKYWSCVLEVDVDGDLPSGSDFPMRVSVVGSAEILGFTVTALSSGWGLSEKGAQAVINESCKDENQISSIDI